ncbi:MAG: CRISPR system precrRNA processing endoribonuclease RAMP protein Cas6 [Bacillota bacterium]
MKINLDYLKLNIIIQLQEDMVLPRFPAITVRGGFGNVLKKLFCSEERDDCINCPHVKSCIFTYIFKTAISGQAEVRNNSQLVAPPYIINVPYTKNKKKYKKGELLELELTILGKAIDYLSYFVYAFEELGKEGLGQERSAYKILYISNSEDIIYKNGELQKEIEADTYVKDLEIPDIRTDNIILDFTTPFRIEKDGKLLRRNFSFELILRNILRRLDSITYFYLGYKLELDFHSWIKKARNVKQEGENLNFYDNIRYSRHSKRKIWMGGYTGTLEFSGNITPFIPFLQLGSIVHIGKKCVFGMGGYSLKLL